MTAENDKMGTPQPPHEPSSTEANEPQEGTAGMSKGSAVTDSERHQDTRSAESPGVRRRTALAGAFLGVGAGVAVGAGARGLIAPGHETGAPETVPAQQALTTQTVNFYGDKQAGIMTPAQAHARFIALDLNDGLDASGVQRLLRILTSDAAALTAGQTPLTDQEPELVQAPAHLTITFGFGEKIFDIVAPAKKPAWLKPLPAFPKIDQLQQKWNGGDLLLQICGDNLLTVSHAQRMLTKETRSFGRIRWVQEGFLSAFGTGQGTPRNLFGQVDGTVNPVEDPHETPGRGGGSAHEIVWGEGSAEQNFPQAWEPGGTSVVIRRIHMNLDTWDEVDTPAREDAIGRKLSNGAPLTGNDEFDDPDFDKLDNLGFEVIAPYAHIRRAHGTELEKKPWERILRRGYNYDEPVFNASGFSEHGQISGGISDAGLIFVAYQADPVAQFVPIQKRLEQLDMLNTWTVPVGSAVFAIPAGVREEGGYIGESLFT